MPVDFLGGPDMHGPRFSAGDPVGVALFDALGTQKRKLRYRVAENFVMMSGVAVTTMGIGSGALVPALTGMIILGAGGLIAKKIGDGKAYQAESALVTLHKKLRAGTPEQAAIAKNTLSPINQGASDEAKYVSSSVSHILKQKMGPA